MPPAERLRTRARLTALLSTTHPDASWRSTRQSTARPPGRYSKPPLYLLALQVTHGACLTQLVALQNGVYLMAAIHRLQSAAGHTQRLTREQLTAIQASEGLVPLRLWGVTPAVFRNGMLYVAHPSGNVYYRMKAPGELSVQTLRPFSPYHIATAATLFAEAYRCLALSEAKRSQATVAPAEPSWRHPWFSPKRIMFFWNRLREKHQVAPTI